MMPSCRRRSELHVPVSVDERCLRLSADDGSAGTLLGMRCIECGIVVFGPATFCQSCTSPGLEQIDLATEGTLYSYTIVRVPPPGWARPGALRAGRGGVAGRAARVGGGHRLRSRRAAGWNADDAGAAAGCHAGGSGFGAGGVQVAAGVGEGCPVIPAKAGIQNVFAIWDSGFRLSPE